MKKKSISTPKNYYYCHSFFDNVICDIERTKMSIKWWSMRVCMQHFQNKTVTQQFKVLFLKIVGYLSPSGKVLYTLKHWFWNVFHHKVMAQLHYTNVKNRRKTCRSANLIDKNCQSVDRWCPPETNKNNQNKFEDSHVRCICLDLMFLYFKNRSIFLTILFSNASLKLIDFQLHFPTFSDETRKVISCESQLVTNGIFAEKINVK